jgi:16S rRNA (cytosine967-C5)-methyltransferase
MADGHRRARALALAALDRIERGAHAHVVVPELLARSALAPRDRAFVTDHVHGTVRLRRLLDARLSRASDRPLDALDTSVRSALRLGAHQLHTGVPPHAAVGETVAVAPARARGFVNAVLRRVAGAGADPPGTSLGVLTSHPDWIVDGLVAQLGAAGARAVLDADNEPPAVTLRVRPGIAPGAVVAELASLGARVEAATLVPGALVVRGGGDPAAWPALRDGRATVQDQASQAVVHAVEPAAGERIVDVAAAPGGKATGLAERVGAGGTVVALDRHAGRLRRLAGAAQRMRLPQVRAVVADGRRPPLHGSFDAVLVDAPCSGLGVLRRRPDARWRVAPSAPGELAVLQRALVGAAWPLVRAGGRLVYSVCTWTTEETDGVAAWALAHLPDARAEAPGPPWRPRGPGGQLLPSDGCDGMFVLRLSRGT